MNRDATIVSGRRVADRYRLVDPRGDGTWTAVDETLRRTVVVHVLPAGADPEAKEHFTAEARTLARLSHRNIVATYDTGIDGDGTSYRVDELASGTTLDLGGVVDEHRVSFARQIAHAISDAHDAGLVHGQLSSTSALVDDAGRVQLRGLRLPRPEEADAARRADVAALTDLIIGLAPPVASPLRDAAVAWRRHAPSSARTVFDDVAAIPDDSLEPSTPSAVTPPTGVPATRHRGRAVIVIGAVVLIVAAVVVAVVLPARKPATSFQGTVQPLHLTARSFDPQANPPTENEADAHLAVDGNKATAWKTDLYHGPHFANLKRGLGLILVADSAAEFDSVTIATPSRSWTVAIYAAEQPAAALSGWGNALAGTTIKAATSTLSLHGARGHALLVWITDPGPARQVRISDVTVRGRVAK